MRRCSRRRPPYTRRRRATEAASGTARSWRARRSGFRASSPGSGAVVENRRSPRHYDAARVILALHFEPSGLARTWLVRAAITGPGVGGRRRRRKPHPSGTTRWVREAPIRRYGQSMAHRNGLRRFGVSVEFGARFCERCGRDQDSFASAGISLHSCTSCGVVCCSDCWNLVEGACLRCAPFRLDPSSLPRTLSAPAPDVGEVNLAHAPVDLSRRSAIGSRRRYAARGRQADRRWAAGPTGGVRRRATRLPRQWNPS